VAPRKARLRRRELLEAFLQIIAVGPLAIPAWHVDQPAVQLLESVAEHGAIVLLQDVGAQVDAVIGIDPEDADVVGSMMDPAQ
jgi:hypothetical protein